jgi:hypothetical protein
MDQFGEIRITKLQPETAVAWEGEHARGTITLEASGWGTKVSLTAVPVGAGAGEDTRHEPASQPEREPGNPFKAEDVKPVNPVKPELANPVEAKPVMRVGAEPRITVEAKPATRVGAEPITRVEAKPAAHVEAEPRIPVEAEPATDPSRWTRRLAQTLRRWFSGPPLQEAGPRARAAEPVEHPASSSTPMTPVGVQPASSSTPMTPVGVQPASSAARITPVPEQPPSPFAPGATFEAAPRPQAPPQPPRPQAPPQPPQPQPLPEPDPASTAALDAALDSLGRAHHRPFSRA